MTTDFASKIDKKTYGILGCGWLGFPLAQRLRDLPGTLAVKGSTTSREKLDMFKSAGIEGYIVNLENIEGATPRIDAAFFNVDKLIIALPPRAKQYGNEHYPSQMRVVAEAIRQSGIQEIIFISSTSVYPDLNREVVENDVTHPQSSAAPEIVEAENIIAALRPEKQVCVLRLGGLLGYNRIPGKYVKGQKNLSTGKIPVNYIHRDDAVGIIHSVVKSEVKNETYNVVAPMHPAREAVYALSCAQFGWEPPTYSDAEMPDFKVVLPEKLQAHYAYSFQYPDPLDFYYSVENK